MAHLIKWDECICHAYSDNPGKLVRFTDQSWSKLCDAPQQRQDDLYQTLKPYIDKELQLPVGVNDIYRHEGCYKVYTLKRSIQLAVNKRKATEGTTCDNSTDLSPPKRMTRTTVGRVSEQTCIICQELYKKDPKDRRRSNKAVPFTLFSAVGSLQNAATIRGDQRILSQLGGGARGGEDAIAGDVLKHE